MPISIAHQGLGEFYGSSLEPWVHSQKIQQALGRKSLDVCIFSNFFSSRLISILQICSAVL